MNLKELPLDERPREKLIRYGAKNLTDSELLAMIISTGNKKEDVITLTSRILKKYNLKSLSRLSAGNLKKQFGIGDAKACQIISCFELGRRLAAFRYKKQKIIKNAKDIAKLFLPEMSSLEKEYFIGIYLDSRRKIIKQEIIFIGSLNESVVHPREIFKIALDENAAAIIIIHNHPSGDPSPSSFDIEVTKEIVKAGDILGINILDHIIFGGEKYVSLKEEGLL